MVNYDKLKTNLKVSIERLKLLQKKKTENTRKSTYEIAELLKISKAFKKSNKKNFIDFFV